MPCQNCVQQHLGGIRPLQMEDHLQQWSKKESLCYDTTSERKTGASRGNSSPADGNYGDCDESTACGKMICRISNRVSDNQWPSVECQIHNHNKMHIKCRILEIRWVNANELMHDLSLSHGTVSRMTVQLGCVRCIHESPASHFQGL